MSSKQNIPSKIKSAIKYRKFLFDDETTTAFRIFNSDGDGINGLTIDFFDGYYLITWFNTTAYQKKKEIVKELKLSPFYKGIYQKKKFSSNDKDPDDLPDFICGDEAPSPLIIKENNINFAIHLDDGAMVGIFLDQRDVRKTIRDKYSEGKTMLNTFSYTGAFSVSSALGGATKTTSVDLAKRSLSKTKEQFQINNIDLEKQSIVVEDVFHYFKYAVKKNLLFDLLVLDPPSFARTKKITFSVAKDYVKLLKEAIQITEKNGVIAASTNYANLTMNDFKGFIDKAFKELKGDYKIEEIFGVPKDFKNSHYLKVVFIRKIR
ncbi:MAG: class I SAM-dependent rRNA methyltransferase [Campylobacterota bacterium]|nr:class I SAM-dependent rRNA methyltransferase [Campylobacterota bacterium]